MNKKKEADIRLELALERARHREELAGIGTQSEKLVHLTLKYYLEPDESAHEVKVGRYTADIFRKETGEILEIQTRAFERLKKKLEAFVPKYPVTVVFPCVRTKYLAWVDPETGEISKRRRSPRKGQIQDVLPELYRLGEDLFLPRLTLMILMMDVEEDRLLDGWSHDKKRGSHRMERLPLSIEEPVILSDIKEFAVFLPEGLPETFTRETLMKALHLQGRKGGNAITVLERTGVIERIGKEGRKLLFQRPNP